MSTLARLQLEDAQRALASARASVANATDKIDDGTLADSLRLLRGRIEDEEVAVAGALSMLTPERAAG